MWPNLQVTVDLVTFTEEILHGKLHFLCSVRIQWACEINLEKRLQNVESKNENENGIQDESQKCENFIDSLFNILKHHCNKIIMTHININSLKDKFDMLANSVTEYIDILMISETKLDDTFRHA